MEQVVIIDALRSPIGKYRGMYKNISAKKLAVNVVTELFNRHPKIKGAVNQAIFGQVLQAGSGQNIARQIALESGLSQTVPAMTVNEVCGSGLKALILGMEQIQLGKAQVVLAGGCENMTRAPYISEYDKQADSYSTPQPVMIVDGLTDALSGKHMGLTAENVAEKYQITRQMQDTYALQSHQKAATAMRKGYFESEIVPVEVEGTVITCDESVRPDTSLDKLASLKTVFKAAGTVTAGNASPLNDGASAVLLASESYAKAHQLPILAKIKATSEVGIDPQFMGISPIEAIQQLMKQVDLTLDEIDLFEINEAFAASSIVVKEQLQIPDEKINIVGGAISLGHPIGASGARIVTTLAHQLKRTKKRFGIASLCIGGGLGLAMLIENPQEHSNIEKKKFQQLTIDQRQDFLRESGLIDETVIAQWQNHSLDEKVMSHLIENVVTDYALPVGIVPEFIMNEKTYYLPFATEEPSVVAACSYAAKMTKQTGGFQAEVQNRLAQGQIVLQNIADVQAIAREVEALLPKLKEVAQQAYPSIVKRGGGVVKLATRTFNSEAFLCVDVWMDTKEAMGANMLNTVLEAMATELRRQLSVDVLMAILTNYTPDSLVTAKVAVDFNQLDKLGNGRQVAQRIVQASRYAQLDPFRAVTHNKGIMNGIEALCLALGNDTRALSANIHAFASQDGQYKSLSTWEIVENQLVGKIQLPLMIASVGGATHVLPKAASFHQLLQNSDAKTLSMLLASVGLAQNLAALRALVSEGIQKGHMKMQARSLAMSVGANEHEIASVVEALLQTTMNQENARQILTQIRKSK